MKWPHFSLFTLFIAATFAGCKKDNDSVLHVETSVEKPIPPPATTPVQGLWIGKQVRTEKSIPVYFSFSISNGGSLDVLDAAKKIIGTGIWTLNGENFKAEYIIASSGESFSASAIVYKGSPDKIYGGLEDKLSGTWGYNSSDNDGGFWDMSKIN